MNLDTQIGAGTFRCDHLQIGVSIHCDMDGDIVRNDTGAVVCLGSLVLHDCGKTVNAHI